MKLLLFEGSDHPDFIKILGNKDLLEYLGMAPITESFELDFAYMTSNPLVLQTNSNASRKAYVDVPAVPHYLSNQDFFFIFLVSWILKQKKGI